MRQNNNSNQRRGRNNNNNNRSRGRGGSNSSGGSRQSFDSNGPSVRIRGSASQIYDKYAGLARDATTSGDPVMAESLYQHAEHYYRIAAEQEAQKEARNASRVNNNREKNTDVKNDENATQEKNIDDNEIVKIKSSAENTNADDVNADNTGVNEIIEDTAEVAE